jgi:uncharacterized membrane protein
MYTGKKEKILTETNACVLIITIGFYKNVFIRDVTGWEMQ